MDDTITSRGLKAYLKDRPAWRVRALNPAALLTRQRPLANGSSDPPPVVIVRLSGDAFPAPWISPEGLARLASATRLIALVDRSAIRQVPALLQAGVLGYLDQDCNPRQILRAIAAVRHGKTFYDRRITEGLAAILAQTAPISRAHDCPPSPRETAVVKLIAAGRSTKEIASELQISQRTAEWHRLHLEHKLGVRSVAGLVHAAIQRGLCRPE